MADALERLQVIIEADASGVGPAANQAASAMEGFGRRAANAGKTAASSMRQVKQALAEAQRSNRLDAQMRNAAAAMQQTNREYDIAAKKLRELQIAAGAYRRAGKGDTAKGRAAELRADQQAARMAALQDRYASQEARYSALQQEAGAQKALAETATDRAEAAQNAANATRDNAEAQRELNNEIRGARKGPGIFSSIGRALRSMLLIRSVISAARHFVRWLGQAAMANREFNAAVQSIRGNLISAFAPIYEAIIPWLTQLANAIATVVGWIGRLTSWIFGSASSNTEKMLSGIGGAAGGANKEIKQLLANFDELNVLDRSNGGGSGGGGGGSGSGYGGGGAGAYGVLGGTKEGKVKEFVKEVVQAYQLINELPGWKEKGIIRDGVSAVAASYREEMRPYDISGYPSMSVEEYKRAQEAAGKTVTDTHITGNMLKDFWWALWHPNGEMGIEDILSEEGKAWYRARGSSSNVGAGEMFQSAGIFRDTDWRKYAKSAWDKMGKEQTWAERIWGAISGNTNKTHAHEISSLNVGAGEVAQSIEDIGKSIDETSEYFTKAGITGEKSFAEIQEGIRLFGINWNELSLGEQFATLGDAGIRAAQSIVSGWLGATQATESTATATEQLENTYNSLADAVNRTKDAVKAFFEEQFEPYIDKKKEKERLENQIDWNKNAGLNDSTRSKVNVNTYDKNEKYGVSASTLPSHGGVNGAATYNGSGATSADIQAGLANALSGVKIEVDGNAFGKIVIDKINQQSRYVGKPLATMMG